MSVSVKWLAGGAGVSPLTVVAMGARRGSRRRCSYSVRAVMLSWGSRDWRAWRGRDLQRGFTTVRVAWPEICDGSCFPDGGIIAFGSRQYSASETQGEQQERIRKKNPGMATLIISACTVHRERGREKEESWSQLLIPQAALLPRSVRRELRRIHAHAH